MSDYIPSTSQAAFNVGEEVTPETLQAWDPYPQYVRDVDLTESTVAPDLLRSAKLWRPTKSYAVGDKVIDRGLVHVAKTSSTNVRPPLNIWGVSHNSTYSATTAADAGINYYLYGPGWDVLQTTQGGAMSSSTTNSIISTLAPAINAKVKLIYEPKIHYTPSWLASAVPAFKNQSGEEYVGTGGESVRDWVFTQAGRDAVEDFIMKHFADIKSRGLLDLIEIVRISGGPLGELRYPSGTLPDYTDGPSGVSFWGYSQAAQSGVGLAAGMSVCPLPGYVYQGDGSANDTAWAEWYLDALNRWMVWSINLYRRAGWLGPLAITHPSFGLRSSRPRTTADAGMLGELAFGTDWDRQIRTYAQMPGDIWPWATWLEDNRSGNTTEGGKPSWAKLADVADAYFLGDNLWGENAEGGSSTDLTRMFSNTGSVARGYRLIYVDWTKLNTGSVFSQYSGLINDPSSAWKLIGVSPQPVVSSNGVIISTNPNGSITLTS